MPSPFHQKYSSQSHKMFGSDTTPSMPEGPKQDVDRRASDASVGSSSGSPTSERRRVRCLLSGHFSSNTLQSSTSRFANLEALKRPADEASINRRSSLQDSYAKSGWFGSMWNKYVLLHSSFVLGEMQIARCKRMLTKL